MDDHEDKQKPPLARLADVGQPASLSTKTGGQRFVVTIKLPERSLKSASKFVTDVNDALNAKIAATPRCELAADFVLIDSERARLQRATASFSTFKEAQTCLSFLADLGLRVSQVSAELEDFGIKQYDPWHARVSKAWWPWLAAWRDPAPEMPMMKVTNRLNLTEGSKYKESAGGKLGKSDDEDRQHAPPEDDSERRQEEPAEEERPVKKKKRGKKRE